MYNNKFMTQRNSDTSSFGSWDMGNNDNVGVWDGVPTNSDLFRQPNTQMQYRPGRPGSPSPQRPVPLPQHRPPQHRPPQHRPPQHRPPQHRPPQHRPPQHRPPQHRPPHQMFPPHPNFQQQQGPIFIDQIGRRCRVVCDPMWNTR